MSCGSSDISQTLVDLSPVNRKYSNQRAASSLKVVIAPMLRLSAIKLCIVRVIRDNPVTWSGFVMLSPGVAYVETTTINCGACIIYKVRDFAPYRTKSDHKILNAEASARALCSESA